MRRQRMSPGRFASTRTAPAVELVLLVFDDASYSINLNCDSLFSLIFNFDSAEFDYVVFIRLPDVILSSTKMNFLL